MADANVKSLEAIETFYDAIVNLRDDSRKLADDIREQLQRVSAWLEKEMPDYWGNELKKSERKWTEARDALLQCQSKTRAEDETSCSFEKKQLTRATERRTLCEQRVRTIPQLALLWNQFLLQVSTNVRQLDDQAESGLPLALSRLQTTIDVLKKYMST